MATTVKLSRQMSGIIGDIYKNRDDAEAARIKEYNAAVVIQSWYRGLRSRAYLRYLSTSAQRAQKIFRGFESRKYYRSKLKQSVQKMRDDYYNYLATYIQKVWKGFYVRKYVFNYYSFKRYLEGIQVKNRLVRSELADYAAQQKQRAQEAEAQQKIKDQIEWARKHHYLVSTEVISGIYNSPYYPEPFPIEYLLKQEGPRTPRRRVSSPKFDPIGASYGPQTPKWLPPLPVKPQGPFRKPEDVREQRYRKFNPTLRVQTSIDSELVGRQVVKDKEFVTRLNDIPFQPFTKRQQTYEPMHHRTTEYGHPPYGNAYFRDPPSHTVSHERFRTLVPPIHSFDKLNATYSQGEV